MNGRYVDPYHHYKIFAFAQKANYRKIYKKRRMMFFFLIEFIFKEV